MQRTIFQEKHVDLAPSPDIINKEEEYKVEVWNYRKQKCGI